MIGCIIFARVTSTRFPGKVVTKVKGKTILEHVINRVAPSNYIDKSVIATTTDARNNIIEEIGSRLGLQVFRGSETDVLNRCYEAAPKKYDFDPIVRVTADDPFKDIGIIDRAIRIYLQSAGRYDMVCNTLRPTFPEGLDVEVFSFKALERTMLEGTDVLDREHVTLYMLNNTNKFKIFNFTNEKSNLSYMRLTLDTKEDLELVESIYDALYDEQHYFTMGDIVTYLKRNPNLIEINKHVTRSLRYRV